MTKCTCVDFANNATMESGTNWKTCGNLCTESDPWCKDSAGNPRPATYLAYGGTVDGCCKWKFNGNSKDRKCNIMTRMTCPYGTTTVGYMGDARGLCYTESEGQFVKILIASIFGGILALVMLFHLVMRSRGYQCVKKGKGKWKYVKPHDRESESLLSE